MSRQQPELLQQLTASFDLAEKALAAAVELVAVRLVAGHQLFVCGYGRSSLVAERLQFFLVYGFEIARPALPVHFLHNRSFSEIPGSGPLTETENYRHQLGLYSQPKDVLILFVAGSEDPTALLIEAKRKGLSVILFASPNEWISRWDGLDQEDVQCYLSASSPARFELLQFTLVAGFCILLDQVLFSAPTTQEPIASG